jgi:hypothetical protein
MAEATDKKRAERILGLIRSNRYLRTSAVESYEGSVAEAQRKHGISRGIDKNDFEVMNFYRSKISRL